MLKDTTVRARINSKLKGEAESVLNELGLSMSDAITIFLAQVKLRRGLPFSVDIPNEETARAIQEARTGVQVQSHESVEDIFKGLDTDAEDKRKE